MREEPHIPGIHFLTTTPATMFFIMLIIITTFPQYSYSQPPFHSYSICKETSYNYNCGKEIQNISYPFWGQDRPFHCGGGHLFKLTCTDNQFTTILIGKQSFQVVSIDTTTHTINMTRTDRVIDVCSSNFEDTDLSPNLFRYLSTVQNMTIFFDCPLEEYRSYSICGPKTSAICYAGSQFQLMEYNPRLKSCERHIQVPTEYELGQNVSDYGVDELERGLREGFRVKYTVNEKCIECLGSDVGGDCGNDIDNFVKSSCYYCPDGSIASSNNNCSAAVTGIQRNWNWKRKFVLGLGSAVITLFVGIVICLFRKISTKCISFGFMKNNHDQVIEAFLKTHGALSQKRYKFSEVKKMTNSFKTKLGQGGFGVVYKGKLHNSSPIAVKILKTSKGDGEEFINEVASISRTSHVNVVTLVGFCFEGCKKALIYEFMPNGSLDNFIYNKGPQNIASLSWEKLYQIAKGIARGLEYLHKGCNTRILHFDIKPHNILLDEYFCPKISDFGLAKLCPRKESVISMSVLRGTIGYIAPEMWNRRFGGVSHKSDVYSYGMMLLEMVGVRKNINSEDNDTSEYFPDWIYNKLELDNNLSDGMTNVEENEIARRMTIVGLWCIQMFPNDRPAMSKVVEMLEGSMNSLDIPPKPMRSSPNRSVVASSTS